MLAKVLVARDQLKHFTLPIERQGKGTAVMKKNLQLILTDHQPLLGAESAEEVEEDL